MQNSLYSHSWQNTEAYAASVFYFFEGGAGHEQVQAGADQAERRCSSGE